MYYLKIITAILVSINSSISFAKPVLFLLCSGTTIVSPDIRNENSNKIKKIDVSVDFENSNLSIAGFYGCPSIKCQSNIDIKYDVDTISAYKQYYDNVFQEDATVQIIIDRHTGSLRTFTTNFNKIQSVRTLVTFSGEFSCNKLDKNF